MPHKRPKSGPGTWKRNTNGLRRGNPGNKGRPPEKFKLYMRKLVNRREVMRTLKRVLRTPGHPHWGNSLKLAMSYGYGQPAASLEVTGKLSLEALLAESWKPTTKDKSKLKKRKRQ
jgi:hypothetical protein